MTKKRKKATKDTTTLLFVHKSTYLASMRALGYYLTDLSEVYAQNLKALPKGHPALESMKQQIQVLGDIFNAFDASLETSQKLPRLYTEEDLN